MFKSHKNEQQEPVAAVSVARESRRQCVHTRGDYPSGHDRGLKGSYLFFGHLLGLEKCGDPLLEDASILGYIGKAGVSQDDLPMRRS